MAAVGLQSENIVSHLSNEVENAPQRPVLSKLSCSEDWVDVQIQLPASC